MLSEGLKVSVGSLGFTIAPISDCYFQILFAKFIPLHRQLYLVEKRNSVYQRAKFSKQLIFNRLRILLL